MSSGPPMPLSEAKRWFVCRAPQPQAKYRYVCIKRDYVLFARRRGDQAKAWFWHWISKLRRRPGSSPLMQKAPPNFLPIHALR